MGIMRVDVGAGGVPDGTKTKLKRMADLSMHADYDKGFYKKIGCNETK